MTATEYDGFTQNKYKMIDMIDCLKFMCSNFKYDFSKINMWLLDWFNVFLSIDKINLTQYIPLFLK